MIYLAIGRRERGKSTLVYALASKLPQRIVIDPRWQFDRPHALRATTPEDVEATIETLYADVDIPELIVAPAGDVQPVFEAVCDAVKRWIAAGDANRSLAVVVDEARFYNLKIEAFHWILRCAPRTQIYIFLTAHRPTDDELPVSVQSIADYWLLFHTTQQHDLRVIRDRAGDAVADRVERLSAYQWVQWDDGRGAYDVQTDSAAWFVPIHGTAASPRVDVLDAAVFSTRARTRRLFDA